jgi:hypothetical protein
LVFAVYIIRALFNKEWREAAQAKVDSVRKERIFWQLVNGYEGMAFDIYAIFTIYLNPKLLGEFIIEKATNGSSHVAFTPFPIDFQAVCGLGCQF